MHSLGIVPERLLRKLFRVNVGRHFAVGQCAAEMLWSDFDYSQITNTVEVPILNSHFPTASIRKRQPGKIRLAWLLGWFKFRAK